MEIINHKKKEMIPLLIHEENNFYNEQEVCYICKKKKFCMDKNDKNCINKKRLKIIVIILENLEKLPIVNVTYTIKF